MLQSCAATERSKMYPVEDDISLDRTRPTEGSENAPSARHSGHDEKSRNRRPPIKPQQHLSWNPHPVPFLSANPTPAIYRPRSAGPHHPSVSRSLYGVLLLVSSSTPLTISLLCFLQLCCPLHARRVVPASPPAPRRVSYHRNISLLQSREAGFVRPAW
jgi:hypothetical protein